MKARPHNRLRPGHRRLRLLAASRPAAAACGAGTRSHVCRAVGWGTPGPRSSAWAAGQGPSISDWTALEAQLPANAAADPLVALDTVACPSDGSCVATGNYTDTSGDQQGLIETLASGTWTAAEAQLPANAGSDPLVSLGGLTCITGGSCVATGNYSDMSSDQQGLIETLAAGTWTAVEAPVPPNAGADPRLTTSAPACPAVGNCVVTGEYTDTSGNVRSAIDTLSAGTWSAVEAPLPAGAAGDSGSSIGTPACTSDGSCVAMDEYTDSAGNVQTAIETLSGGIWTPLEAPLPADEAASGHQRNLLSSVYCPATGSCVAVGSFAPTNGTFDGFIETLSGGIWTPLEAPLPANAPATDAFARLDVVTCAAAGSCVALGWYYDTGANYHGVMETLSSDTWMPTEQPLPAHPTARNPTNPDEGVGNAFCPSSGSCIAVGSYFDKARKDKSTIETLAAGAWALTKVPLPTKGDGNLASDLHDVTCSPDGTCVAVGSAGNDPLVETLPGGNTAPAGSSTDQATFTVDEAGTFTISATGTPLPFITKAGKLPKGLHFASGTGTATISGTPIGAPGNYSVTIEADNGVLPSATQFLTLTIVS